MGLYNVPYLCGGIFFDLLLESRKNRQKARNKLDGGSDGLSDPEVMKGFIYVVTGDEMDTTGDTLKKSTSQYRSCQIDSNTYINLTDISIISSFNNSLKNKNPDLLNRMSGFIDRFINKEKLEWLVKALIETIYDDKEIDGGEEFNISLDCTITKKDLKTVCSIEIEPFLLSVLHFIIMKRPNNKNGKDTFDSWFHKESNRKPWQLVNIHLGNSIQHPISVRYTNCSYKTPKETEFIETEIIHGESSNKAEDTTRNNTQATTIIKQQTNVVQYGEKNIHINHLNTLNL